MAKCPTKAGDRVLKGSVTNPTKKRVGYSITFSWISEDARVVGRGVAVVRRVRPGATARWKLEATVGKGAAQCVPNVLRGTIPTTS